MVSKILAYVLAIIGIAIVALMKPIQSFLPFIPTKPPYILLVGVAFVLVGIVLLMTGKSRRQESEVPIYDKHGKNIVGYRRMK